MAVSQDGKRIAFQQESTDASVHLWTMPLEVNGEGLRAGKPELFLQTAFSEGQPSFSPDGRWLAYTSNESGKWQVCVRAFPDRGAKWQISISGGRQPLWSRGSRELFFHNPEGQIMVATYTANRDAFLPDKPRLWSEARLPLVSLRPTYDLAPDGKRVVALMVADNPQALKNQNHLIVLLNFFDELSRRIPTDSR